MIFCVFQEQQVCKKSKMLILKCPFSVIHFRERLIQKNLEKFLKLIKYYLIPKRDMTMTIQKKKNRNTILEMNIPYLKISTKEVRSMKILDLRISKIGGLKMINFIEMFHRQKI